VIAQTQAEWDELDAREALRLRSPKQIYDEVTAALNRQIDQLTANGTRSLTYGQSLDVAAANQTNLNQALEATIDVLTRQGKARDGVTAFFLKMQEQAISTARIVYDALEAAFDKISDNLTELITSGKTDFAKMFEDIGKQILNSTIRQSLQKGLAGIGAKLGIDLGNVLGGQRGDSPTNPLYTKDVGGGSLIPGLGGGRSSEEGGEDGAGISTKVFSKIGDFFSGLWSKLGSFAGTIAVGASKVFSFLGGLIPHAEGGMMMPNHAYLVGERGPEILTGISGQIMSNATSRRILSAPAGPTVYYSIDARGTDPVLTEQRTRAAIFAAHNSAVTSALQVSQERLKRTPQR
jgi:Lambda phage tail tape-measure protein (Tape_meas_lam_C)